MTTTQTWLITGASSGLGLALTKQALAAGHHVVATTRKEALPVKDPRLTVARLDPADREGCRHARSEEHTSELQSRFDLVCRLLLEKKKNTKEGTRPD